MIKISGHVLFSVVLILVGSYAVYSASHWSFKTGFFPLTIGIPLIILALAQLLLELFGAPEKVGGPAVEAEFSTEVPPDVVRRRVITVFSWIAGFILLVFLLGFPIAVPLFLFSYLALQSGTGLWQSLGLTAMAWGFFYFVFQRLIHLQFEDGLLQRWLGL
ncbi:MAG TPA: tripartite tricarboxylate transporter TctB family protein [Candidatus Binatia bacterium]|nr:tripartite tricarboxylate transporter TctB family protein [Candidatus Binatia bacterium]